MNNCPKCNDKMIIEVMSIQDNSVNPYVCPNVNGFKDIGKALLYIEKYGLQDGVVWQDARCEV